MDLIIRNVDYAVCADGVRTNCDIEIEAGTIRTVRSSSTVASGPELPTEARCIEGRGKVALTGFKNAHTHAAMTLLRGYGDDMLLQPWLQKRIWPAESKLTPEDVYWGTRLAVLEMIKSGTTFANDMYFHTPDAWRAFQDGGIRAAVGLAMFDFGDAAQRQRVQANVDAELERLGTHEGRVFATIAPHSIYTCSGELLLWAAQRAEEHGLVYHIHMSETRREVEEAIASHGKRPFQWLEALGVLSRVQSRSIAAHAVWLDEAEHQLVAEAGLTVAHNPASNMKLASGAFPYAEFAARGTPIMLAPDGPASNNNLDMFDEMKLAALLQKHHWNDPTRLSAHEILSIAGGARSAVFRRWGVGGSIAAGEPADLILVDASHPQLIPMHNVESNLVYAANGAMVDTVICAGRVLMENRVVPGEEEVRQRAAACAAALVKRAEA